MTEQELNQKNQRRHPCKGSQMTREDIEQAIYERTKKFIPEDVQDAIIELILAERKRIESAERQRQRKRRPMIKPNHLRDGECD